MRQKFFTNTIQSKFIKALLGSTYLPIYPTIGENNYLTKEALYIYKTDIFRCIKTGYPNITDGVYLFTKKLTTYSLSLTLYNKSFVLDVVNVPTVDITDYGFSNLVVNDEISFTYSYLHGEILDLSIGEEFVTADTLKNKCFSDYNQYLGRVEPVDTYVWGEKYPKFTGNFESKFNYYDSETHEHLGNYLRCLRDIKAIDLMPFYNCFSGDYASNIYFNNGVLKRGYSENYKVLKIPVRFNTKYTIAIDSASQVFLCPVLLDKFENIVQVRNNENIDISAWLSNNFVVYNTTRFNMPFVYEVKNRVSQTTVSFTHNQSVVSLPINEFLQRFERNLYLLIQIPKINNSSIVVLEGDYTGVSMNKVFDVEHIEEVDEGKLNEYLLSKLSLLQFSDKVRYPFSDRLIEFLLLNAITSEEYIDNNVARIQTSMGLFEQRASFIEERERLIKKMSSSEGLSEEEAAELFMLNRINFKTVDYDIWSNELRKELWDLYMSNTSGGPRFSKLDITGFVDKNMERFMLKEALDARR